MAHVRFHGRKRVHSAFREKSHTTAYTPKQGPSFPRPQRGFALPVKSILFRHAFIYIHFPVLCGPPPSATAPSQTIFHRVFQPLAQMPHARFRSRKWVHHSAFGERSHTAAYTPKQGAFRMGALLLPSDCFTRFGNPAWPGLKTANFAAFGSWLGVLPKNAEAFGAAMRLCASLLRGVAAPLGCATLLLLLRSALKGSLQAVAESAENAYPPRTVRI